MSEIKKVEIELTSRCNAACPGCRRTIMSRQNKEFPLDDLDAELIYQRFSDFNLTDFHVKLCGVLGDPLVHPEMLNVTRWFTEQNANVQISTNASLRSADYWRELGELSRATDRVYLHFAVDGLEDTNHVYRVNTSYKVIERNMRAYADAGGKGAWIFIEFDHNSHQKDLARSLSEEMSFEFFVRRAAKNSVFDWLVDKKKEQYTVVKKVSKAHDEVETYKKIRNDEVQNYDPSSVNCKFQHGGEFFLAADGTVWPCCYLWDEHIAGSGNISQVINDLSSVPDWNQLKSYSFGEIFGSPFYREISHLWNQQTPQFQKRCYLSCGAKGKLRNSFSKD